jgi:hypothetical protein
MAADWFYLCGGEIVGPLSANDLRDQFVAGQLTPETPVRRGGEGNWVPAKKVKGLCDAPPPAPVPPPPVAAAPPPQYSEPSYLPSPALAKSSGGAGKSIALFLIGGVLLVVAFVMNDDLDRKEKLDSDLNHSVGNLGGALTGRYEYKETKKQDRVGVYAVGGIGALFILGGFVTLGGNKSNSLPGVL